MSMIINKNSRRSKVVSISLPKYLNEYVEQVVNEKKFASKSEFFRYLLHLYREKVLRRQRDMSAQDKAEINQYKLKKHFEDVTLLSQLIANSIATTKDAGQFEEDID